MVCYETNKARSRVDLIRRLLLVLFLVFSCLPTARASDIEDSWQDVSRIIAVGDAHGDFDRFLQALKLSKVINRRNNWIAGDAHLVQIGDVPDRGPDSAKIVSLLKKLETQARRHGGKVHALIGNHEAMNILGDLRYVDAGEFAAQRTRNSSRLRERFYEQIVASRKAADPAFIDDEAFRDQWLSQVPLGYVEHRLAWSPTGEIGSWVVQHNAIIRINRVLFLHAGISNEVLGKSIREINEQVRSELSGNLGSEPGLSESDLGPLWYRGLATGEAESERMLVDSVLATYDVDRIVIGHTPGLGTIAPRFDGRVLVIDSGISGYYGGHIASLLIEGDKFFTVQRELTVPIPDSDGGLLEYYQTILDVEESAPMELHQLVEKLRGL